MSRISGPGIDIVMTASPEAVESAIAKAEAAIKRLERETNAALAMASRAEAASRPMQSAGGARLEFAPAARAAADLRKEQELLVSVQKEATEAATDWSNSVGQNFIPATNEWAKASDSASISIGKIASTLGWVTAAATGGYAVGRQIADVLLGIDTNTKQFNESFDSKNPTESLKAIDAELQVLQNRIANFDQAGMSPGKVSAFFESGFEDAIQTQQRINLLEAQRDRINEQVETNRKNREAAALKETLQQRIEGEKKLAVSRLSLADQEEAMAASARQERDELLLKATTDKEKEQINELFKLRLATAKAVGDQYYANLEKQKQADREEQERKEQKDKEQRERDAQRAAEVAKSVADALMKANEAWRKDFEEQSRAVTQELASQFQNTLAGFAGILEQQAGAARRGPWREI